jgi:hypothetical protein
VIVGWASKIAWATGARCVQAKAHWIDDDGQPACAKLMHVSKERGLETVRAPFTCTWGPHVEDRDHLCRECRRLRDPKRTCRCGKCRVEASPPECARCGDVCPDGRELRSITGVEQVCLACWAEEQQDIADAVERDDEYLVGIGRDDDAAVDFAEEDP